MSGDRWCGVCGVRVDDPHSELCDICRPGIDPFVVAVLVVFGLVLLVLFLLGLDAS